MKKWVLGNWKMCQNLTDIESFFSDIGNVSFGSNVQAGIAPQFLHIPKCLNLRNPNLLIGAQNFYPRTSGAFTGEVSIAALTEVGVDFFIIGHSERRALFHESHSLLAEKVVSSLDTKKLSVFCVGETLNEREGNLTQKIILEQLEQGLRFVDKGIENLIIAYEPVWAIGTGKTATPKQAEEVHIMIRQWLNQRFAQKTIIPILYGGSVKPENFNELLSCPEIAGGLVGGASLDSKSFLSLCSIASQC